MKAEATYANAVDLCALEKSTSQTFIICALNDYYIEINFRQTHNQYIVHKEK